MYRRFYSRSVIDQMKKDEFDDKMESMFKDYNAAMYSKDNFICQNMDILERIVDKTSIIKSESLKELMFGDLDKVIKKDMRRERRAKREQEDKLD